MPSIASSSRRVSVAARAIERPVELRAELADRRLHAGGLFVHVLRLRDGLRRGLAHRAAGGAGVRGFDRGVEREQRRLARDRVDQIEDRRGALARRGRRGDERLGVPDANGSGLKAGERVKAR
jgi:hypothetical protein